MSWWNRRPDRRTEQALAMLFVSSLLHVYLAWAVGFEVDGSWPVFILAAMLTSALSFFLSVVGFSWPVSYAISAGPAVVMARLRGYWMMSVSSPGGAAQDLLRPLGLEQAPGWAAAALVLGAISAGTWGLVRVGEALGVDWRDLLDRLAER